MTTWPDSMLASMLNVSISTVQAYRTGRRVEHLSRAQRETLLTELRRAHCAIGDLVDELWIFS